MNVLRWCSFVHLFDTPFQNSPYGHVCKISKNTFFTEHLWTTAFVHNEIHDEIHDEIHKHSQIHKTRQFF